MKSTCWCAYDYAHRKKKKTKEIDSPKTSDETIPENFEREYKVGAKRGAERKLIQEMRSKHELQWTRKEQSAAPIPRRIRRSSAIRR